MEILLAIAITSGLLLFLYLMVLWVVNGLRAADDKYFRELEDGDDDDCYEDVVEVGYDGEGYYK